MFHRSLKAKRAMICQACCVVLLVIVALPRFMVHSHAGSSQACMGACAFTQHLQLFHADSKSAVPPDKVHLHWLLGNCADTSLSSTSLNAGDTGHDHSLTLDYGLAAESLFDTLAAETSIDGRSADIYQSFDDVRVRFCVWTC